jgi:acyl-CoA synthetase (AMP-forming)/AMP-acid ligase II
MPAPDVSASGNPVHHLYCGVCVSFEDESGTDAAESTTFPGLVRAAAAAYGDRTAIKLIGGTNPGDSLSFTELDRRSAELARGLIALGVGKGARIGFIYGNNPSFALLLAAISRVGAVAVPISTFIKANELVRVLRQSDVGGLIVQRSLLGYDHVKRVCDALPGLRDGSITALRLLQAPYLRWIASSGDGLPPSFHHLDDIVAGGSSVSEPMLREIESEVCTTDQMLEIYTSGSMALPKGVRHNHGPVLFRTHYLRKMMRFPGGVEIPVTLPMFWVGGLMMFLLPCWEVGSTVLCTERTSTDSRTAMGSVLSKEDLARMPRGGTHWALGMTETLGPYSYGDEFRAEGWPVCAPIDHVADRYEMRVVNEEGKACGEGEIGEIQLRGHAVTPGLHKVEAAYNFTADGFLHTGDQGLVDGARVHFVGRSGDMIKTAGSNVSPSEVEMELQAIDGVHSAYVVGLPDAERGQLVAAAVVPRDGVELDFRSLEALLRQRLSSFKVPRAFIAITRDQVPMLDTNKVARRQLAKLVAESLGWI